MLLNFELLDLRAFIAVVDLKGFHSAARQLNMSQPALSRRIQALEASIGAALLERTTRRVALTAVGRAIEPLARRLVEEFDRSVESLTGAGHRRTALVTLACIPTAAFHFLPAVLKRFRGRSPSVRLRVLDLPAQEAIESVASGEAELGINLIDVPRKDLVFTPLLRDRFVLVCPRGHPLSGKRRVTWKDLTGHAFIGPNRRSGNWQSIDDALSKAAIQPEVAYEFNHPSTSLALVAAGLGISVLPQLAVPPRSAGFVTRPIHGPVVQRTIGIVERRGVALSPAAKALRGMLIDAAKL